MTRTGNDNDMGRASTPVGVFRLFLFLAILLSSNVSQADSALNSLRPVARPLAASPSQGSLTRSLRPEMRPNQIGRRTTEAERSRQEGTVCGDVDLQGETVGHVAGRIAGCGIKQGVRVKVVAGVTLSQPAVMDCTTAKALKTWIKRGLKPAVKRRGGGVSSLKVAAHYACRTRNNRPGAKISEHGRGRAIDISAIRLRDGSEISVLSDWGRGRNGKILAQVHRAACGPFGTVLGPQADRFHKDHFHFDTARYRSGSYCK